MERPYLTPQFQPILPRMLELHAIYGDGSDTWDNLGEDEVHPFMDSGQRRVRQALAARAEQSRLAACEVSPAKRTRKPKGG